MDAALKAKKIRWRFIAAIYACSLFYLLFQGGKTAFMLFVILNLLFVYLLLGRWSGIARASGKRALTVRGAASHEGSVAAGGTLEVELDVKVPGFYPLPYVIVRDHLVRHNGQNLQFETSFVPNWKRSGQVVYRTPPLQRGEYRFERTDCLAYDIFGLFEHKGSFQAGSALSVLPQTVALRDWSAVQRGIRGPFSHAAASRAAKETTQINGVREYLYGDRLSRIHWNATAKTGQWKSKAFERESLPRTLIILDRCLPSYDGAMAERFELAVSVAASLLEHGLRNDTAMGLFSAGEKVTMFPPKSGTDQRNIIMKHLTLVDADAPQPLYAALTRADAAMEPGSFALLVTGETGGGLLQSAEWLSKKGMTPCVLHIGSSLTKLSGNTAWKDMFRSRGWLLCEIRQLGDLPAALEGSVTA